MKKIAPVFFLLLFAILPFFSCDCLELPDFDKAMGKGTTAWNFIRTPEDQRHLAEYKTLYRQGSQRGEIPQVFHWIWLGPRPFSHKSAKRMKRWMEAHPGWRFKLWTDQARSNIPPGVEVCDNLEILDKLSDYYFNADSFGEKSEIFRLAVLAAEGGVYLDHDVDPLQPIDPLVKEFSFFCGLETLKPTLLSTSVYPTTHLIGSAAHHPVVLSAIDWLVAHWDRLEKQFPGTDEVSIASRVKHRGFRALSYGIALAETIEGAIVLPSSFFSESHSEKGLYAIHHHLESWLKEEEREKVKQAFIKAEEEIEFSALGATLIGFFNLVLCIYLYRALRSPPSRGVALALLFACASASSCFSLEESIDYHDFFTLMGKGTSHWKYVHQERDLALLSHVEELYQKNKEAQFSQRDSYRIPPVLHLIWLGPHMFPPQSVENLRSWIAYHPDWTIKLWTDRDREPPCDGIELIDVKSFHFSRLEHCFHVSNNYAEKSDILRYEILLAEGGIYLDHDTYCLASFDSLVRGYDFFCCLEAPHEPFVGANVTCWNGLIGARPGHPAMNRVIDLIAERWDSVGRKFRGKDPYSQVEVVMQRTYIALTHALEETLDLPGNTDIVFPAAYFFAKSGIPSIYSKHFCRTTWDPAKSRKTEFEKFGEKTIKKIRHKSNKIMDVAGGLLLLNSLLLVASILLIRRRKSIRYE
jgi:mannosyltransferase OCH1-like enzyme